MLGFFKKLDNIKVGAPGAVFACETDGFKLRGAIIKSGVSGLEIGDVVESRAVDFRVAVGELVEQLEEKGKKPPKKAILSTPSVVGTLLELPVNPSNPRTEDQMQELIRWELEPLFGQQNDIWSVGALLMGRGYLSTEQREQVAKEQSLGQDQSGKRKSLPFGEVALQLELVTREQIDESLAIQEQLILVNDDLTCGWAPQVSEEEAHSGQEEIFPWYAVGIGKAMSTAWEKAFRINGLVLEWIYPQLGNVFAVTDQGAGKKGEQLLLEVRQEQMAVFRGHVGQMAAVRVSPVENGSPDPLDVFVMCQEQLRPDLRTLHLFSPLSNSKELAEQLAGHTGRKVEVVQVDGKTDSSGLGSLAGAASHYLGRVPVNTLARLNAQPPKQPVWKRKELYPYATAVLILFAVVAFDATIRFETWQNVKKEEELTAKFKEKLGIKKKVESDASKTQVLEEKIEEGRRAIEKLIEKNRLFEKILLERQESVPGILRGLASAISDEIILDGIFESKNSSGIRVTGWALTDTGAEIFLNQLGRKLDEWGMSVSGAEVSSSRGRLGLDGYGFSLWLVPQLIQEVPQG
ncbi:MAG: hypothetical protein G3M70_11600 [Candidatus Nitronauta litoralis]|uniref:Uncharacterized protein n=1 Tax=Candidatus Nitronauta litoralis TaxID=2705533 RepID=A0A7T0G0K1_9BACT|nr:MAG: hypothetical protein G3M70_11600 [Candidatus Nitronauta litoralis]